MAIIAKVSCSLHPSYTGKSAPHLDCSACWHIHYLLNATAKENEGFPVSLSFTPENFGDETKDANIVLRKAKR